MKALIFNSPQFGEIRTAGSSDQPLFCLADVCRALDLEVNNTVRRLDKGVCCKHPLATEGGVQSANFINEDGLYDVIFDSRKPEAKAFRKWVTSEVLPSIRKTGSYGTEEVMALRAERDESERRYLSLRSEFDKLHNVYRAVADSLDDQGTHSEKLSFLIHKVNVLIAYNKELGKNISNIIDSQALSEVDFSGVSDDTDLLEVLRDIIVDYPLCASESTVADIDAVERNVKVLRSLYAVIRKNFSAGNETTDSLVCK